LLFLDDDFDDFLDFHVDPPTRRVLVDLP
jgi:hypothetical protein